MNIDNEGTEQPMQADQEDRPYDEFESSSSGPPLLSIVIGIILIALIGAWFMLGSEEPPAPEPTVTEITPAAPPEPLPEPEPVVTPAPDIPEPDPVEALPEPNTPPPPPRLRWKTAILSCATPAPRWSPAVCSRRAWRTTSY
ncbi:hypothetical protein [Halioglobus japonicus]|uniref:hypothetical protein n=1 Tax=Halioglobus japonicus TaxID=930805 RepID=UPI0012F4DE5B|nr:hypothetical protein [Halioglobus japonicus]